MSSHNLHRSTGQASSLVSKDGIVKLKLGADGSPSRDEEVPLVPAGHPFAVLPRDLQEKFLRRQKEREEELRGMEELVYGHVNDHFGKMASVSPFDPFGMLCVFTMWDGMTGPHYTSSHRGPASRRQMERGREEGL